MRFQRATRRTINPAFRVCVYRSGLRRRDVADRAGFANFTQLSSALNQDPVAATPLLVERLRAVAAIVRFDPDAIFLPDSSISVVRDWRDRFDAEHLPVPGGRS